MHCKDSKTITCWSAPYHARSDNVHVICELLIGAHGGRLIERLCESDAKVSGDVLQRHEFYSIDRFAQKISTDTAESFDTIGGQKQHARC